MSEANEIRAALTANARFYTAFAAGDYAAMETLWSTTAPSLCVHPGAPAIHGRSRVMASWRSVLERPPTVSASAAQASVIRGIAFVTCFEHIGEVKLVATNAFVWEDGDWLLVHHQAGPVRDESGAGSEAPRGPLH
jgi:hypothetical protein